MLCLWFLSLSSQNPVAFRRVEADRDLIEQSQRKSGKSSGRSAEPDLGGCRRNVGGPCQLP